MNTYTAQIIYRINCSEACTEQYEEQWRLIFAEDSREALAQARKVAKEEECTFIDRHGRTIGWQMVAIKDIQEISLKQGALLFSAVKEVEPIAAPVWTEN